MASSVRALCAVVPSGNGHCLATYLKALSFGFPAPIPVIAVLITAEKGREVSVDYYTSHESGAQGWLRLLRREIEQQKDRSV